jgi:membrane fusion protein (multidrug efflux system)
LTSLRIGQRAYLTLDPWPDRRFEADVLRISPVVDAATGTIKVTLEVRTKEKLRPGMFARVFLETATRANAIVVPKAALSLESIGDTVYVAAEGLASRREVALGFREGDFVEIVSGVAAGEAVVVVGQDGLSDGTPIRILDEDTGARLAQAAQQPPRAGRPGERPGPGGRRPDFASMTPEQLDRAREFMRGRGMTEEQIATRIESGREQASSEQP